MGGSRDGGGEWMGGSRDGGGGGGENGWVVAGMGKGMDGW